MLGQKVMHKTLIDLCVTKTPKINLVSSVCERGYNFVYIGQLSKKFCFFHQLKQKS